MTTNHCAVGAAFWRRAFSGIPLCGAPRVLFLHVLLKRSHLVALTLLLLPVFMAAYRFQDLAAADVQRRLMQAFRGPALELGNGECLQQLGETEIAQWLECFF